MRFELVRDVSVVKSGTKGLIDRLRLNETLSEIRVGRTSANQMRLQPEGKESMGLSRYHARFVKSKKDGWMLIDNKSTNGTYINSIKIPQMKPVELAPNDVIVFGGGGSQAVGGRKRQREGERERERGPRKVFLRHLGDAEIVRPPSTEDNL